MSTKQYIFINTDGYDEESYVPAVIELKNCTEDASIGDLVVVSDTIINGVDVVFDNLNEKTVIGVILEKPSDSSCMVLIKGEIENILNMSPGKRVFLSECGEFTTTIPTTGYIHILGIALSDNKILFTPETFKTYKQYDSFSSPSSEIVTNNPGQSKGTSTTIYNDTSLCGNWLAVGTGPDSADDYRYVYIYKFNGTSWVYKQRVTNSITNSKFGFSVSIHRNIMVIGDYNYSNGTQTINGIVYVYRYNGTSWVLEQSIEEDTPGNSNKFGYFCEVYNNRFFVTTRKYNYYYGFIYRYNGTSWILEHTFNTNDVDYGTLCNKYCATYDSSGTIYLFKRTGTSWSQVATKNFVGGRYFHIYNDEKLIIGDVFYRPFDDNITQNGKVYIYDISGDSFTNEKEVFHPELAGGIHKYSILVLQSGFSDGSTDFYNKGSLKPGNTVELDANVTKISNCSVNFGTTYLKGKDGISFGTGNFTIETYIQCRSSNDAVILGGRVTNDFEFKITDSLTKMVISLYGGSVQSSSNSFTMNVDEWYHVAVVRSNGTVLFFLDGTNVGSVSDTNNYVITNNYYIGNLAAYIDLFRVSSSDKYTGNFTPPSSRFIKDSSISVLIQPSSDMPGKTNAIVNEADEFTIHGNVHHETDQYKFKSSSVYFDGNGDALSMPSSNFWDFGLYEFSVDFQIRISNTGSERRIIGCWDESSNDKSWLLKLDSSNHIIFSVSYDGTTEHSITGNVLNQDTWYHILVCRYNDDDVFYLYIDGVNVGSVSAETGVDSVHTPSCNLVIGANYNVSGNYFNGYLDELRIVNFRTLKNASNFISHKYSYTYANGLHYGERVKMSKNYCISSRRYADKIYIHKFDGNDWNYQSSFEVSDYTEYIYMGIDINEKFASIGRGQYLGDAYILT